MTLTRRVSGQTAAGVPRGQDTLAEGRRIIEAEHLDAAVRNLASTFGNKTYGNDGKWPDLDANLPRITEMATTP